MTETGREPADASPRPARASVTILPIAGLVYLGLGVLLLVAFTIGGVQSSLFPTGWLFPAVLLATGALMARRRRFDIVMALWGGLVLAVFMLNVLLYVDALNLGLDDPAAFDAAIIVAGFGLAPLILRPGFSD